MHACVLNCFSHVQLFVTPWTAACQAPLSMEFSSQEHWTGLPCPPPGDLLDPGIESLSLISPALVGGFIPLSLPGKLIYLYVSEKKSVSHVRLPATLWTLQFSGIHQAVILEWVAVPFSRESFQPRDWIPVSSIKTDCLPAEPPGKPIYLHTGLQIPKVLINTSEASVVCQSPVHFSWTPALNFQCHQDLESKSGNGDRSPGL